MIKEKNKLCQIFCKQTFFLCVQQTLLHHFPFDCSCELTDCERIAGNRILVPFRIKISFIREGLFLFCIIAKKRIKLLLIFHRLWVIFSVVLNACLHKYFEHEHTSAIKHFEMLILIDFTENILHKLWWDYLKEII